MVREIMHSLTNFGFTQYESKTYLTLLNEKVCSARDLSDICGMPYGKTYEIIKKLAKKGYVELIPTKPLRCSAVSPENVFKQIRNGFLDKLEKTEEKIRKMNITKKKQVDKTYSFLIVKGRSLINKKIEAMINNAKKQIFICTTKNGIERFKYFEEILNKKKDNGVEITILCSSNDSYEQNGHHIIPCIGLSKNSFISTDGKISLFYEAIPDNTNYVQGSDVGMNITDKSFTCFLDNMFSNCVKLSQIYHNTA